MKIEWNQNPLWSNIVLETDEDKEMFVTRWQNDEMSNLLCSIQSYFTENKLTREKVSKWQSIVNTEFTDESIQRLASFLDDVHIGDCTCVPCTCMKCYVEEFTGISTINGIDKHQLHKIDKAFSLHSKIDGAIEYLAIKPTYIKQDNWRNGYEIHIPRWETERIAALGWLKEYKEKHSFRK